MSTTETTAYFEMVMGRLKKQLAVNSDSGLASLLGISAPAYANRKRAGSIPYEAIIRVGVQEGLDVGALFGPEGPPVTGPDLQAGEPRPPFTPDEDPFADFELIERKGILGAAGPAGAENVILQKRGALAFRRAWLRYKNVTARELIVVDIDGDSMEKTLFHRDTVVFREQAELTGDDIYLFLLEGRLFVKRLSYRPGVGIEVISDNRDHYPPITLSEKEAEAQQFQVKGRFLWRGGDRLQ